MSGSVALAVNVSKLPWSTDLLPIADSTGGWFTSSTVISIGSEALRFGVPSSVTITVTGYLPGPCASVGVQRNTPVIASMLAPAGASSPRLNIKAFFGMSGSVALAVKVSSSFSFTDLLPMPASTGASFTSLTVTVIVSKASIGGVPSSVTRTVMSWVPGPSASVGVQVKTPVVG